MFRKTYIVVLAAAAVLISLTALSTAQAAPPTAKTTAVVYSFADGKAVPGSLSTLRADTAGVTVALHTYELPLNSDSELWWLVYNAPDYCRAGTGGARCGMADLRNKAAQPATLYGGGQRIGSNVPKIVQDYPPLAVQFYGPNQPIWGRGRADFISRRAVGDQIGVVFGAGLTNPLGAEIHIILLSCSGGEAPTAKLGAAPRVCANKQYAVHQQQPHSD